MGRDLQFTGTKRFYKVMMPGFTQELNLPKKLYNKLTQEKSDQAVLKSCKGTFHITVSRDQELGLICFEDGWPDFVRLHGLCLGDFLLFEHIGNLHFNVFVFDESACEKDLCFIHPKEEPQEAPQRKQMEKASGMSALFECKNPFFTQKIRGRRWQMYIPSKFWTSNGFQGEKKVVLRDPSGMKWPVKLSFEKNPYEKCRMGKGWGAFCAANKVKTGDVLGFELVAKKSNNFAFDVHFLSVLPS